MKLAKRRTTSSPAPDARCLRIWRVVSSIPQGRVATYGEVARLAGFPRGARLVGWALARLPADSPVPWHRVVNSRGRCSFPPDTTASRRQHERLRSEGVPLLDGRIDLDRYRWHDALDALVWGPLDDL